MKTTKHRAIRTSFSNKPLNKYTLSRKKSTQLIRLVNITRMILCRWREIRIGLLCKKTHFSHTHYLNILLKSHWIRQFSHLSHPLEMSQIRGAQKTRTTHLVKTIERNTYKRPKWLWFQLSIYNKVKWLLDHRLQHTCKLTIMIGVTINARGKFRGICIRLRWIQQIRSRSTKSKTSSWCQNM